MLGVSYGLVEDNLVSVGIVHTPKLRHVGVPSCNVIKVTGYSLMDVDLPNMLAEARPGYIHLDFIRGDLKGLTVNIPAVYESGQFSMKLTMRTQRVADKRMRMMFPDITFLPEDAYRAASELCGYELVERSVRGKVAKGIEKQAIHEMVKFATKPIKEDKLSGNRFAVLNSLSESVLHGVAGTDVDDPDVASAVYVLVNAGELSRTQNRPKRVVERGDKDTREKNAKAARRRIKARVSKLNDSGMVYLASRAGAVGLPKGSRDLLVQRMKLRKEEIARKLVQSQGFVNMDIVRFAVSEAGNEVPPVVRRRCFNSMTRGLVNPRVPFYDVERENGIGEQGA